MVALRTPQQTPEPAAVPQAVQQNDTPVDAKVPGIRCPTCANAGNEVWVIPGRNCGYCGTVCDDHQ